jgi:hypothetical protein
MSTISTLATPYPATAEIPAIACNRTLTIAALVGADMLAVLCAGVISMSVRLAFHGNFQPSFWCFQRSIFTPASPPTRSKSFARCCTRSR